MAGMTRKEIATVLQGLADQGCELVPKKNGTVVRFPNGGHTSFHYSQSDTNDRKYSRALIRRNGLKWPLDGEHPKKREPTVARTIHPDRYAAVDRAVAEREAAGTLWHPTPIIVKESGVPPATVRKIMDKRGYLFDAKRGWTKPVPTQIEPKLVVPGYGAPYFTGTEESVEDLEDLLTAPQNPTMLPQKTLDAIAIATRTFAVDSPLTASSKPLADKKTEVQTEQKRPEEREFIDTHDSWQVDNTPSIENATVGDLRRLYAAAGLEMELRVWRKS